MAYKISDNSVIDDNRELTAVSVTPSTNLVVPYGTTANRPAGAVGKLYFDTDLGKLLVHNGTTWVESSTAAGSTGGDFAVHGAKYVMPLGGGAETSIITLTPVPYNEAITSYTAVRNKPSVTQATMYAYFVKFKGMQDEVQLTNSSTQSIGGTGGWPCPPEPGSHSGVYNVDRNMFQPHATLSLDNTAININIGGEAASANQSGVIHSWLFDSKFPNEGFVMSASGVNSENIQRGGYGIYKYSDTQYITWGGENLNAVGGSVASAASKLELRSFNPNNIAENQNATAAAAYADWYKRYTPTRGSVLHSSAGSYGGGMCYGVWKSATPNQLTVMSTNNQSLNNNSHMGQAQPFIGIFDINVNTGAVVPASTTEHLEFSSTINGNLWTTNNATVFLPAANNFTVCECSTHVTMISWPENSSTQPYAFWIYDKANRTLRAFHPEIYDNSSFNSGTIENHTAPNRLWMNHFKMNDKIYLTTCEMGSTHSTHEGVHIYETSATAATPYMRIYNDTNNHQAIQNPQKFQQIRALKSADSFTFQHNHANDYQWYGIGGSSASIGDAVSATGLTVNPETSKTIIQSTFANVKSGAWSGSTPTYRLNPGKISFATADITRWSDVDGPGNTSPNDPGSGVGSFWRGNLARRKFFGGGTQ